MKRVLLFMALWICMLGVAVAQNPLVKQWDKRFGGTDNEWLYSLQKTADGGFILGGSSNSGISGDKTQNSWGGMDYWVVKIDSLGNKQYDYRFGGVGSELLSSLQQTADNGYILGGSSNSGIGGDKTQNSWGDFDYWIVKLDSLGNKQWDKRFGGASLDFFWSLRQTGDQGYILGGWTLSGISGDKTQPLWGGSDYWIVKIDSLGNKHWDMDFGGIDIDYLYSLQQTADGGYILGGHSKSGISGDKTQSNWDTTNTTYDYWIVKTDSLGNKQWDRVFGGTDDDRLYSLEQTADRGCILGGFSKSGISGNKTQPNWDPIWMTADYWIAKIDSVGNKQWDKVFGGISGDDDFGNVHQTADSGYLLAGTSYSPISGNKTENNLGPEQTWIVKADSIGNYQWDKTVFTIAHDESGWAIQINDGCYAIANYTNADIGGYKTQPNWDTTFSSSDYWIIKFCDTTLTTSIQSAIQNPQSAISLSPNPASEYVNIQLSESFKTFGKYGIEIRLTDVLGRAVFTKTIHEPAANLPANMQPSQWQAGCQLSTAYFSSGIYFLSAKTEKETHTRKLVVNH